MANVEFRIGENRNLPVEIRRLYANQLNHIDETCNSVRFNEAERVHEIRKSFKRSRALLRLLRDHIGYSSYFRENNQLKSLHRLLSGVRDLEVLRQTMKSVNDLYSRLFSEVLYDSIMEFIYQGLKRDMQLLHDQKVYATISSECTRIRERMDLIPGRGEGFYVIGTGLGRIYHQGQDRLKVIYGKHATPEQIHDFRKRAKYLYYHFEVLRPLFPRVMKAYARTLEQLTDILGKHNDLVRAKAIIPGMFTGKRYPSRSISVLFDLFEQEKSRLMSASHRFSNNIYTEEPDKFIHRLESYWNTHMETVHMSTL